MTSELTKEWRSKRCRPCDRSTPPLSEAQVEQLRAIIPEWVGDGRELSRTFSFKNYYQTVAFVNAVVWIAHQEDHHPEISFGYKTCCIRYHTHAIGGLSENDFICAAKIDALVAS